MRRLRSKIACEKGASMAAALLFFLVCTMVSASILLAASTAVARTRSTEYQEQKYLALSSALSYICDDITNSWYTGKAFIEVTAAEKPEYVSEQTTTGSNVVQVAKKERNFKIRQLEGLVRTASGKGEPLITPLLRDNFDYILNQQLANDLQNHITEEQNVTKSQYGLTTNYSPSKASDSSDLSSVASGLVEPGYSTWAGTAATPESPASHEMLLDISQLPSVPSEFLTTSTNVLTNLDDFDFLKDSKVKVTIDLPLASKGEYALHVEVQLMIAEATPSGTVYTEDTLVAPLKAELVPTEYSIKPSLNSLSSYWNFDKLELLSWNDYLPTVIPNGDKAVFKSGGSFVGYGDYPSQAYHCGGIAWVVNSVTK